MKIIRNESSLDRPDFRVSTDMVMEIASLFDTPFTSGDIAEILVERHRGIGYSRIERSVRACLSWLVAREIAHITGEEQHITPAGCTSKPFLYAIHPWRTWNKEKSYQEEKVECDFEILNRIFVYR